MATEHIDILLRLRGFTRGIIEMTKTASAARGIGKAMDAAAVSIEKTNRRSFLMNQTLFTMRRLIFGLTLGVGILGASLVAAGFRMNATVERTTIALDFLTGSLDTANSQVREFQNIARETAFLPQQIIDAGQQLHAFGFEASQVNRILRATGDAIAALNLPQSTVDRIVLALGQIAVKGRVTGEELRQLANANIPAYSYLATAFGENVVQIGRIADAGIDAEKGIEAILTGLEKQYGGASERIRETTTGQWEILKGDTQVIFGAMVAGAFQRLSGGLQNVTDVTGQLFDVVVNGNGSFRDMVVIVDEATGGAYHLERVFITLGDAFTVLWDTTKLILNVLEPFIKAIVLIAYVVTRATTEILSFINMGGRPLVWILRLIIFYMLIDIATTKIYYMWKRRAALITKLLVFWVGRLRTAIILKRVAMAIATGIMIAYGAATSFAAAAMTALATAEWAVLAPWLIMIGLVVLLISILVILEVKFKTFSRAITNLWDLMKRFGAWLDDHNPFKKIPGFSGDTLKNAVSSIPGFQLAGAFANFGTAGSAGTFMVGERGPELVHLPAGTRVGPVAGNQLDWGAVGAGGGNFNITITPAPVMIDGRQIAEVVFKHRADRIARR